MVNTLDGGRDWENVWDDMNHSITQAMNVGLGVLVRTNTYDIGESVAMCFIPGAVLYENEDHEGFVVIGKPDAPTGRAYL